MSGGNEGMNECHREDKPPRAQRQKEDPQFNDGEGTPRQPHASSNTNTFITVYGFLGSLTNPQAPGGD